MLRVEPSGSTPKDPSLHVEIDADARAALDQKVLGPRVLITDRNDATIGEVVTA